MTRVTQISEESLTKHSFVTLIKCKLKYICDNKNCKRDSWTTEKGRTTFRYDPYVLIEPGKAGENTLVGAEVDFCAETTDQ